MRKLPVTFFAFYLVAVNGFTQSTLTATYTVADLPTSYNVYDPGCSNATLSVTLPAGGSYQVTNTNVEYVIQALGGGNRSEQRSQLVLQNTNTTEPTEAVGSGGAGFQFYNRSTTIGNGIYPGGTVLTFLLQAKRTAEITPGCNTSVQKIVNSSWIITVSYTSAASIIPLYTNGCSLGDSLSYFSLKGTGSSVIYNPSGGYCNTGAAGFSDYTTQFAPVDIVKGECFTGFMKTGSNDNYATIWIDANDNNLFEDNERILDNLQIGTVKKLYSIYIPATMNVGIHRLRVRTVYTPLRAIYLTHPVNSYDRGEVEDYLVNITNTPSTRFVAPTFGCNTGSATTIGATSNNNSTGIWIMLMDSSNRYIVGIDPSGNNAGTVWSGFYKHNVAVRKDIGGRSYLDRNPYIATEYETYNTCKIRAYYMQSELNALIADPGSGVTSQFDLVATQEHTNGGCYGELHIPAVNLQIAFPNFFGSVSGDRYIEFNNIHSLRQHLFLHGGSTVIFNGNGTSGSSFSQTIPAVSSLPFFSSPVCNNPSSVFTLNLERRNLPSQPYLLTYHDSHAQIPDGFEATMNPALGFSDTSIYFNSDTTLYIRMTEDAIDSLEGFLTFWKTVNLSRLSIQGKELENFYLRGKKGQVHSLAGIPGGGMVSQSKNLISRLRSVFKENNTCNLIAKIQESDTSRIQDNAYWLNGNYTAKVWVENNPVLFGSIPYVARHFEITPKMDTSVRTRKVTLYVSQAEFDAYNSHPNSLLNLPANPFDAASIANLRVYRYNEVSSDGSGLPYTYPVSVNIINPDDDDIRWNTGGGFWEISVDVKGFGGFFVGTSSTVNACPAKNILLTAGKTGATYQWQVNTGSGYSNIANGGLYLGVTTNKLLLISPPTILYGYKYRCMVDGSPSAEYEIKFVSTWLGNTSTNWATGGNWAACGTVPDVRTDVVIPGGRLLYPVVSGNSSIRSLRNESGSSITVATGVVLTIVN